MCISLDSVTSSDALSSEGDEAAEPGPRSVPDELDVISWLRIGLASDPGGRIRNEDATCFFSTRLPDGSRATIAAVLDGHHREHVVEEIARRIPNALIRAARTAWQGAELAPSGGEGAAGAGARAGPADGRERAGESLRGSPLGRPSRGPPSRPLADPQVTLHGRVASSRPPPSPLKTEAVAPQAPTSADASPDEDGPWAEGNPPEATGPPSSPPPSDGERETRRQAGEGAADDGGPEPRLPVPIAGSYADHVGPFSWTPGEGGGVEATSGIGPAAGDPLGLAGGWTRLDAPDAEAERRGSPRPGDAAAAPAPARIPALLRAAFAALDTDAWELFASGRVTTGGATLLLLLLHDSGTLWSANVGDCKAVLSNLGAPLALNECHNPDVPAERARFARAGVTVAADHVVASDLNVLRSLGDYDLGRPLKWFELSLGPGKEGDGGEAGPADDAGLLRGLGQNGAADAGLLRGGGRNGAAHAGSAGPGGAADAGRGGGDPGGTRGVLAAAAPCPPLLAPPRPWGRARGALACPPEIRARSLGLSDEFVIAASDGLWDYYGPESSAVTHARRRLRSTGCSAQATAEELLGTAVRRQRDLLHEGTPGDNVTVVVLALRPLPRLPRHSASRLNLRAASLTN